MTSPSRRLLPTAILLVLPSLAAAADASDVLIPKLAYTGEATATLDGGKRSGTAYAGQLMFGADVDLDAAFGWRVRRSRRTASTATAPISPTAARATAPRCRKSTAARARAWPI